MKIGHRKNGTYPTMRGRRVKNKRIYPWLGNTGRNNRKESVYALHRNHLETAV
jgi:hypothetical protein